MYANLNNLYNSTILTIIAQKQTEEIPEIKNSRLSIIIKAVHLLSISTS